MIETLILAVQSIEVVLFIITCIGIIYDLSRNYLRRSTAVSAI
jgi:hypothetical protein